MNTKTKNFDKLTVPFAVCVNIERAKSITEWFRTDYFVIAHIQDYPELKSLGFKAKKGESGNMEGKNHRLVCEYEMSEWDIDQFKKDQKLYVKVKHTLDGRVYELKSLSFFNHVKNISLQNGLLR